MGRHDIGPDWMYRAVTGVEFRRNLSNPENVGAITQKEKTMLFNIKTAADFRAALYALLPILGTLLVGYGVFTDGQWQLWAGLAAAVLGPVVAVFNTWTVSGFRTAFYAVVAAVQAIVVGYGLTTDVVFETWMPLVVALVGLSGASVAVANTDTSPSA